MATAGTARPASRDDRLHPDSGPDNRTAAQRDRDRILYTSAFRRLAGVTQVFSADEGHVFHNRLTHSLEVAQLARRIAEKLSREMEHEAAELGGIDPDIAEAAALAHDLGHPPFGHIAEEELDGLVVRAGVLDGFEGNPQSFRIVTKLALRSPHCPGLNLTRASLNSILKYPWLRGTDGISKHKRGAYYSEERDFRWAREMFSPGDERRSVEAEIMDWADDVTYAVHDTADFFRAGLIPLEKLSSSDSERKAFFDHVFKRYPNPEKYPGYSRSELEETFQGLLSFFPAMEKYSGTRTHRARLRSQTAGMIALYLNAIELKTSSDPRQKRVRIDPKRTQEVFMLKELTWRYVILNPALATKQYGQRKIIRGLFEMFREAADRSNAFTIFPYAFREQIEEAQGDSSALTRIVTDFISGMTEQQAVSRFVRLTGMSLGSAFDYLAS